MSALFFTRNDWIPISRVAPQRIIRKWQRAIPSLTRRYFNDGCPHELDEIGQRFL